MIPHTQKRPVARGAKRPSQPGTSQCVVRLDDETFGQIRERAIREGTSFAEQIRLLVEWGLEADE